VVSDSLLNRATIFLFTLCGPVLMAQSFTFTKPDSADWTLPENQDRITENVWITRQHTKSIFNYVIESVYQEGSPLGTLWAKKPTSEASNSDYTTFIPMTGSGPKNILGDTVSLYLVDDALYFDVEFHSWTGSNKGGGFSYTRTPVGTVSVMNSQVSPKSFQLSSSPNPFNSEVVISFSLPEETETVLSIFDILGKPVRILIFSQQTAGSHLVRWDGTDDLGRQVSAGVYLYQIQAGEFSQTRKMVLLK